MRVGEHLNVAPGSTEAGPVKHVAGTPGKGDLVTIRAHKKGTASPCPEWIITDHGTGRSAAKKEPKSGTPLKYTFMPPNAAELVQYIKTNPFFKMGWLDVVKPRHYTVVCTSPFPAQPAHQAPASHPQTPAGQSRPAPGARQTHAPTAHQAPPSPPGEHHTLEVYVFPSDSWTLKLSSEENAPKLPWQKNLEKAKTAIEQAIAHITALAKTIPEIDIKLLEGELSLKNGWEEEQGSNLVHWQAELEGKVIFIELTLRFDVDPDKFLAAARSFSRVAATAEEAAVKFSKFLEKEAGLKAKASLYIQVVIKIELSGKAIWEKEEKGSIIPDLKGSLIPHLTELKVDLTAGAGIGGELELDRPKDGQDEVLVKFSGDGSSQVTLSTSPRLESGGNLWLDNKFSWKPLTVTLKAEVNKDNKTGKGAIPDSKPGKPIPGLPSLEWDWSGDLFAEVKDKPLDSLNLTTGEWKAPPAEQKPGPEPNSLSVTSHSPPPLNPASASLKPVPVPQIKN